MGEQERVGRVLAGDEGVGLEWMRIVENGSRRGCGDGDEREGEEERELEGENGIPYYGRLPWSRVLAFSMKPLVCSWSSSILLFS